MMLAFQIQPIQLLTIKQKKTGANSIAPVTSN